MTTCDIVADARRVFDIVQKGGIAIFPNDVGYSIMGSTPRALQKIFETKRRGGHKRHASLCDGQTQRELHLLGAREQQILDALTRDFNLPLGAIGRFRPDHPLIQKVDPDMLKASTARGTLGMLLNAGPIYEELTRLSRQEVLPLFGSSANITGSGPKFRVEDIEPEITAIADIVIDYGLRKFHAYNRSATIIDFSDGVKIVRIGSCYELIADVLKRFFDIDVPVDPGREANASGHLQEFALTNVD